ncbi:protein crooked neck-like [Drosophila serrata]|uniref:protein crooked neck-like n=1 Tax=Drosophila serrata TaxID=7274 RepID=UPI000A1D059D|nr:protein crooked neck-like [Drosophila serrata]
MYKYALGHLPKDRTQELFKAYTIHDKKYGNRNGIEELIPHMQFTFSKLWLLYAQFKVRYNELQRVRKALGLAIGMCPRDKLVLGYIDLEIQLREFDSCRVLY